ncbi:tyrosine-type recombinase/integrase [Pontiella desulfatans]|nr:tyrosine-type recombinase/integrase [Pontiella desulfatans]
MKTTSKRSYTKRGYGRLYIRTKDGRERKPGSGFKGTYYLEYNYPTGEINPVTGKQVSKRKKVQLTFEDGSPVTTHPEAEKARERIVNQYLSGNKKERLERLKAELEVIEHDQAKAIEDANPPLTIEDAWEAYLSSHERPDSGEELLRRYKGYWNKFSGWVCAQNSEIQFLRDISTKDANQYATLLVKKKVTPNTFNKHTCFLRLLFKTLSEPARLDSNPFDKIKSKKLKTEPRRELGIEELKKVLAEATGELQTLLLIGTFTGLRIGDCCTLTWNEVDLERGLIRRVPNKTKNSKKTPVTIGLPNALLAQLGRTPKGKRKGYVLPKYSALYIFRNKDGEQTRRSLIFRETQDHFEKCGIQIHKEDTGYKLEPVTGKPGKFKKVHTGKRAVVEVGFHSLRHTYVSLQAERGTPLAVVQAVVGHGNPAMTAHYTHIGEEAALQAAKALDSGITDAEFEEVREVPRWIREKLEAMTAENWEKIRGELL